MVAKEYHGIGGFAVRLAQDYARARKKALCGYRRQKIMQADFYLQQGYEIEKRIRYAVGDGGYLFKKELDVWE